ncbi:hypothetical protein NX868_10330 [Burkholderia thailandensis]|uniref:hypothetical protein n=1 Tax=Burkholderia thailandensis TaxID=57975 RepID=UPI000EF2BB43|nr:hypothetical protein [Burkholderia thailandensis]AYJ74331.1 hypothetical protein phiE131_065 [Burkholderia phage phiE131]AYJ74401.1 hypothetical protein phiE058_065 [Burkholderia phage phiE058]MCS6455958.1 hypothetical protein [Burkholderia thailandensis]MCS6482673.1 hypothetical protein [Burkholderia thailandensis]NOK49809.1 hypothetical protein [Burkholderia thailandensis]
MRPDPHAPLPPPPRASLPSTDQVRAIRIGALELLLQIEQTCIEVEPAFLATLHKLAQNPVRADLRPAKVVVC